ncbi:734_t:CDS:10 [Funneliformis mosseae]|uniref:734_t:CDS:1 n=1 Tax=Funneliformis mosseae TaxID=27381 RepID=A0A9N9CLU2_FUNMO|nr:734_t:CDS:10 [Funneliformis mosseae]
MSEIQNFDIQVEPDISNVLQNTFESQVPDENEEVSQKEFVTSFNDLAVYNIGKKVLIRGLVSHVTGIKLCTSKINFKCIECQEIQTLCYNNGGRYYFPSKCKIPGCKSKKFTPIMEFGENEEAASFTDLSKFRMQEMWSDDYNEENLPKVIDCESRNNLIDKIKPGDFVSIEGKIQVYDIKILETKSKSHYGSSTLPHLYIEITDIKKLSISDLYIESELDDITTSAKENSFSLRDLYSIRQVTATYNLFKRIVASFCPSIYRHELVKAGILLSLFGKNDNGAIHILIVGDPGSDKTELLSATSSISPNTVFTPINRGDESSILPTLQHDRYFKEWTLKAGSLALSNEGICRIDDFEKCGRFNALAEAITRKSYPIGKYGIKCSLKTQTSIISGQSGQWAWALQVTTILKFELLKDQTKPSEFNFYVSKDKTLSKNLKISNNMLSTFDLIFLLLDIPDEEMDNYRAERVISANPELFLVDISQSHDISSSDLFPLEFLQKYIAYAHRYVYPRLSEEARKILKLSYIKMKQKYLSMDQTSITIRQLETMIKLAQARARMELRDLVLCSDVEDVVEIM